VIFWQDVKRYKFRGSSGKVNLALDAMAGVAVHAGDGPHLRGRFRFRERGVMEAV